MLIGTRLIYFDICDSGHINFRNQLIANTIAIYLLFEPRDTNIFNLLSSSFHVDEFQYNTKIKRFFHFRFIYQYINIYNIYIVAFIQSILAKRMNKNIIRTLHRYTSPLKFITQYYSL